MDYLEYKNFAEQFARTAGDIMRENFRIGMKKEWKSDVALVTEVDIRVNKLLTKEIEANFPEHSILAGILIPTIGFKPVILGATVAVAGGLLMILQIESQ